MHPVLIVLLVLPLLAVAVLIMVRRSKALSPIVPAMTLSGATGAIITAFFAFTSASVPLAPYELRQGAWLPVAGQVLLALYLGFGIGVIIAALMGLPYQFFANRMQP
jgi:uncharacterized membrane protein